jgi:hypothetical protein
MALFGHTTSRELFDKNEYAQSEQRDGGDPLGALASGFSEPSAEAATELGNEECLRADQDHGEHDREVVLGSAAGAEGSGVRGALRLSHGCPGPVQEGETRRCDFAGVDVVRVYGSSGGAAIGWTRTDQRGRFAFALAAGRYVLRVEVPKARTEPVPVLVRSATWTTITLRYLVPPCME